MLPWSKENQEKRSDPRKTNKILSDGKDPQGVQLRKGRERYDGCNWLFPLLTQGKPRVTQAEKNVLSWPKRGKN